MFFHWSLSGNKSPQFSRTLLSILTDHNNDVVWIALISPPFPTPPVPFPSLWGSFQMCQLRLVSPSSSCSTAFLVLWQEIITCVSFCSLAQCSVNQLLHPIVLYPFCASLLQKEKMHNVILWVSALKILAAKRTIRTSYMDRSFALTAGSVYTIPSKAIRPHSKKKNNGCILGMTLNCISMKNFISSLPLLPGSLCPGVVVSVWVSSMDYVDLFKNYSYWLGILNAL